MLLYLEADARLSLIEKNAMVKAPDGGNPVLLPTICIVEAAYLAEKKRIQSQALARLELVVGAPDSFV